MTSKAPDAHASPAPEANASPAPEAHASSAPDAQASRVLASGWGKVALALAWAACALAVAGRVVDARVPAAVPLAALLLLLGVIAAGVFLQGSGVFARPLQSVATSRPRVAVTIDDGPDPGSTRALLDALDAKGHRATFFVIGERAARHPELLAEMARRGHAVENHSLRHSWLTTFTPAPRLAAEIERTSALIVSATGRAPRWFRPPVGLLSPRVAHAVRLAGLQLVGWTATARDGVDSTSAERSLALLQRGLAPGAILVVHDARPGGAALLLRLLDLLDARKLRSVTLDELVRDAG